MSVVLSIGGEAGRVLRADDNQESGGQVVEGGRLEGGWEGPTCLVEAVEDRVGSHAGALGSGTGLRV